AIHLPCPQGPFFGRQGASPAICMERTWLANCAPVVDHEQKPENTPFPSPTPQDGEPGEKNPCLVCCDSVNRFSTCEHRPAQIVSHCHSLGAGQCAPTCRGTR